MVPEHGSYDLTGRTAIVTGAGGDIGRAIATELAAAGASVIACDIDRTAAETTAESVGGRSLGLACDVRDGIQCAAMVEAAVRHFGGLHILVNNAAAPSVYGSVVDLDETAWGEMLAVNLTGAFLMSKAAIPAIAHAGGGAIVHVASQLGHVGTKGAAAYCASKAALIQLARVMALDHAAQNIRVNSLSPGSVLTSRVVRLFGSPEAAVATQAPKHPIGRIGTPEEIGRAALFLVSGASSFMTGADLLVDGGYIAQ